MVRIHLALLDLEIPAELIVGEAQPHGLNDLAAARGAPEGLATYRHIRRFFNSNLTR